MTLAALAGASMTTAAQQGADAGEWRSYGGDTGSTKYSPLAQITPENVGDLAVAWRWESADGRFDLDNLRAYYPALQIGNDTRNVSINGLKGTPLMVGDTLYLTTALSQVAAIDAATGETRWIHDPQSYAAGIPIIVLGFSSRGLAYWTDGQVARIIWATGDAMLHAVDAATGEPGRVDLADPAVSRHEAAAIRRWTGRSVRHVVRRVGESGNANVWTMIGAGLRLRPGLRRAPAVRRGRDSFRTMCTGRCSHHRPSLAPVPGEWADPAVPRSRRHTTDRGSPRPT